MAFCQALLSQAAETRAPYVPANECKPARNGPRLGPKTAPCPALEKMRDEAARAPRRESGKTGKTTCADY
ncbi:protein of unknown function (plasmid) [Nitratireductor aquimarinus]